MLSVCPSPLLIFSQIRPISSENNDRACLAGLGSGRVDHGWPALSFLVQERELFIRKNTYGCQAGAFIYGVISFFSVIRFAVGGHAVASATPTVSTVQKKESIVIRWNFVRCLLMCHVQANILQLLSLQSFKGLQERKYCCLAEILYIVSFVEHFRVSRWSKYFTITFYFKVLTYFKVLLWKLWGK